MNTEEKLLKDSTRADSYKLLSECYHLFDAQLLQRLRAAKGSIEGVCLKLVQHIPNLDEIESLSVDFSRLFIGPFKLLAVPYGSVYLENSKNLLGDSTINAKDLYSKEGLDISLKETPDHVAIELEFMYFLTFKELESKRDSDDKLMRSYLDKQKFFLTTHLGRWISEFTESIEENAQTEFYKNLGRITRLFIEEDLKYLSNL